MKGSVLMVFVLFGCPFLIQDASAIFYNRRFHFFRPRLPLTSAQSLSLSIGKLERQIRNLQSELQELLERIEALENDALPECPSGAPIDSVVFDRVCYSFESNPRSFEDAQTDCSSGGGTLAEPSLRDDDFYQQIMNSFNDARSATQIYLGITGDSNSGTYAYASSGGTQIPTSDPRWDPTPPAALDTLAGVLEPDGTGWVLNVRTKTEELPYICQFPTV